MKERPIIFNDEMVRAILDGRKTQTRRVIKPQPPECTENGTPYTGWQKTTLPCKEGFDITAFIDNPKYIGECPHGKPGDRLWVREMWSGDYCYQKEPPSQRVSVMTPDGPMLRESIWYWADGQPEYGDWERPRPSIHMPRWASRITLEITNVRVERVKDISEEDAVAEGVHGEREALAAGMSWYDKPRRAFRSLWQSIYGTNSWSDNPWVWVIEFRRVEG